MRDDAEMPRSPDGLVCNGVQTVHSTRHCGDGDDSEVRRRLKPRACGNRPLWRQWILPGAASFVCFVYKLRRPRFRLPCEIRNGDSEYKMILSNDKSYVCTISYRNICLACTCKKLGSVVWLNYCVRVRDAQVCEWSVLHAGTQYLSDLKTISVRKISHAKIILWLALQ